MHIIFEVVLVHARNGFAIKSASLGKSRVCRLSQITSCRVKVVGCFAADEFLGLELFNLVACSAMSIPFFYSNARLVSLQVVRLMLFCIGKDLHPQ